MEMRKLPSRTDTHLVRKFWHIGVGAILLRAYYLSGLGSQKWAMIAGTLGVIGIIFDFFRLNNRAFSNFALKYFGQFYRESERTGYSGLPFYAFGVAISLFLFEERVAVLSVFFLVFSDPISSLVGIKFGKTRIINGKSLEGSIAGALVCTFICIIYGQHLAYNKEFLFPFAVFAGIIGSLSELLFSKLDDNLTIPIVSGFGMSLLNFLLPTF